MHRRVTENLPLFGVLVFILVGAANGLSLDSVEMEGGRQFAQLHSSVTLRCRYELEEGQELEKLGWFKLGVPVMTWVPPDPPLATGPFQEKVDLTVTDGALVFPKVEVDDAGAYTCTVQTKDAKQESSDQYHMAVADVPSEGFSMAGNVAACILHFSFTSPPVYPKPTPLCGVWSTDTEYTGTATDWQAVPYYNGSVAYSIEDTTFPVRGMPLQAGIRCEMSFMPSGSEEKIIAWQNTAYYPQVSERGCPPLEVGDGIVVHYHNHRTTCRGELARQDPEKPLTAEISCMVGKQSSLRGGSLSSLQLRCEGGRQWEPMGGIAWDEFEDMECSDDMDGSSRSGSDDKQSEDLQDLTDVDADMVAVAGAGIPFASPVPVLLVTLSFVLRSLYL